MNDWIVFNGGNIVNALLMGYFACKTLGRKTGWLLYLVVTIGAVGVALPLLATNYMPQPFSTILGFATFIAYYCLLFKGSFKSKVLAFVIGYIVLSQMSMLAFFVIGLMGIENETLSALVYLLVLLGIGFAAYFLASRTWNNIELVRSNPGSLMFLLLPISQFAMAFLTVYFLSQRPVNGVEYAYSSLLNRVTAIAFTVVLIVSLIADVAFLKGVKKITLAIEERGRLKKLQSENELMLSYIQTMKSDVDDMHRYRHDMLNIMTALKLSLNDDSESGKEKAAELLDELTDNISDLKAGQYSQCVIVNCVLSFEEKLMQRDGIACELQANVPEELRVDELDLSRIMINILDNAREGCCRIADAAKREIKYSMRVEDNYLYIACSNTKPDGELSLDTVKDDKKNHGYGLSIMHELAEKNGGMADIEVDGDVVKVLATMRLSDQTTE